VTYTSISDCATLGRARAFNISALAASWQSKVVIIKLYIKIFQLPLLMRVMIGLCPAMSSGLAPPLPTIHNLFKYTIALSFSYSAFHLIHLISVKWTTLVNISTLRSISMVC